MTGSVSAGDPAPGRAAGEARHIDEAPTGDSRAPGSVRLSEDDVLAVLASGDIEIEGLVPWSSNYTFVARISDDDLQIGAIYKPSQGEQQLWDFPTGTLCHREVAAYILSRHLGWPDIPPVLLRDGPLGTGTLQLLVDADWEEHFFTIREDADVTPALRRVVLFDVLTNNADRKGGHVLRATDGRIWAIDHGLTFHAAYKLRTVIWDYAGERIGREPLDDLRELRQSLVSARDPLRRALARHLVIDEIEALRGRLDDVLHAQRYPMPRRDWRNVPYPLV